MQRFYKSVPTSANQRFARRFVRGQICLGVTSGDGDLQIEDLLGKEVSDLLGEGLQFVFGALLKNLYIFKKIGVGSRTLFSYCLFCFSSFFLPKRRDMIDAFSKPMTNVKG